MRTNDTHKATNPADEELPSTHADEGPWPASRELAAQLLQLNDALMRSVLREMGSPLTCDLRRLHDAFSHWDYVDLSLRDDWNLENKDTENE